jgi:hypothetical protein
MKLYRWLAEQVPTPRFYLYGFWILVVVQAIRGLLEISTWIGT